MAIVTSTKFFLALLLLSLLSILFINPNIKQNIKYKESFELAFYDYEAMNISKSGLETIIKSNSAIKYKDFYILDKPIFVKKNKDNHLQMIEAIYAKYFPNEFINLRGDIYYVRDDGVELKTDALDYDIPRKSIFTNSLYSLNIKNSIVYGNGFEYDLDKKEFVSFDIKAKIKQK